MAAMTITLDPGNTTDIILAMESLRRLLGANGLADPDVFAQSVHEMGLSVRARKCLIRLNVSTVAELTTCTASDILDCKNTGETTVREMRQQLAKHGLALKGESCNRHNESQDPTE